MVVIIGAGLAGLSAAYHLNDKCLLLEKDEEAGGLCKSKKIDGYVFDYAPHALFTKNEYVKNLIKKLLRNNIIKHTRKSYIYIDGVYVEYPFEVNLKDLPRDIIKECIDGVMHRGGIVPKNFEEWIYATFGDGIAKHYMIPYNQKIWKYDLSKIGVDWIASRVPVPSVEEIKRGAAQKTQKDYGLNAEFYYPKHGGIGALAKNLARKIDNISFDSEVIEIKTTKNKSNIKYMNDGDVKEVSTDHVISSVPLPELVKMMIDVPEDVRRASESLVYNSLICINMGIDRPRITDKHWLYFPEKKYVFNRVSFPMNFSEFTTPMHKSSILVEVTNRENSVDTDKIKEKVIEGLIDSDIIKNNDIIEIFNIAYFKYAYIIYDLKYNLYVNIIHKFLKKNNIIPIGRFGEWEYLNMDKSMLSGKSAALQLRGIKL